nr:reverse transcriptase domain-containing protein [Tanacetum cinerariifolium]
MVDTSLDIDLNVAPFHKTGDTSPKDGRGSNKFTPLTRTPKEIFVAESGKFKPPPPMVTLVEKRSINKFCEFHNDKGHNTDECVQLRKKTEELVRAGKLSYFIKEIRQDKDQQNTEKKDAPVKDKAAAIYMIRPWQRVTRQMVTQSFAHVKEITFPPLTANKGTEGPLIIAAEMGGYAIHRIYVDGGSSMEWGNYVAARTVKALGNYKGYKALYKSMDEFYDSEVTVTVQRYHRKARDKRNPSSTIHGSRNAQVLGKWRNSNYP